jgi:hypothetical protein
VGAGAQTFLKVKTYLPAQKINAYSKHAGNDWDYLRDPRREN